MAQIILFAPLVGAILAGFGWRLMGERAAQLLATGLVFLAAILSWVIFIGFDGTAQQITILRFIDSGALSADWGIRVDRMTAIMLVVVNSVSALVHLYSFGYMAHDDNWGHGEAYRARFFAYLSFFTFSMLALVTSDNLIQMFFGWEGVGVASYLLIGFYFKKESANAASIKAFVVNRVGDFGFALGIFALFYLTGSVKFDDIFAAAPQLAQTSLHFLWTDWNAANLIGVLLFIGAMGKSAQLFLHTWLPDAMEGPTPVSALIHAATMVTAGVFLVSRMSPLYEYAPYAKDMIVVVGATTAFFAATVGLVQNDIKRVIAYSTCSQLGYMFVAAGVGMYPVAMFHLFTHAFFKALLFLGAGSVIHAMHHEQDMRYYGGLRKHIPLTFLAMMAGTLAITGVGILGVGGFAGFYSKDAIIEAAFASESTYHMYGFAIGVIAALLTSFYSWRPMFLTFFGKPRWEQSEHIQHAVHDHHDHAHDAHAHAHGHDATSDGTAGYHPHESPWSMLTPLALLTIGAVFAGFVFHNAFIDAEAGAAFWANSTLYFNTHLMHAMHEVPLWVKLSSTVAMLIGLSAAYFMYQLSKDAPQRVATTFAPVYRFFLNKWYFDELYNFLFIRPAFWFGRLFWKQGDIGIIDRFGPNGSAALVSFGSKMAVRMQSGYLYTYALVMLLGLVIAVSWMMVRV